MIVLESDMTAFFDIDETLVLWGNGGSYKPHYAHIEQLKRHHLRGHKVIVWSKGGYKWAERVVKELKLERYIDIVMAKPAFLWDDLDTEKWMPKREYFGDL